MNWKITQVAEHEWEIRFGNTVHFAQSAAGAVELLRALHDGGF